MYLTIKKTMLYIWFFIALDSCVHGFSHYRLQPRIRPIAHQKAEHNVLKTALATLISPLYGEDHIVAHGDYTFVSRKDWGAEPATISTPLILPVPYVIIHHSLIPGTCHTQRECKRTMRWMQNDHQMTKGYADIGYNFAVGSDGAVYEGRGWSTVGAHAFGYNSDSIGIVFIGNWNTLLPPYIQIETAQKLIAAGVRGGYISKEYMLIGHRQIRETECPGDALFDEISNWDKFEANV